MFVCAVVTGQSCAYVKSCESGCELQVCACVRGEGMMPWVCVNSYGGVN